MALLQIMTIMLCIPVAYSREILYYSDADTIDHLKFDCIYVEMIEHTYDEYRPYIMINQLTQYCRRPDTREEEMPLIQNENVMRKVTFDELRQQGVTSEQLLQWSAPMDIAERYEMNSQSSEIFYNCSSPWFGSKCQYRSLLNPPLSFSATVDILTKNRVNASSNSSITITTCYPFIAGCNRGPWSLCLDWRQICNGVPDCMNGEDERGCEVLEMTVCNGGEYRCHYGGQCIQQVFVKDGIYNTECLDGSDEAEIKNWNLAIRNCLGDPVVAFRCDDHINRYPRSFPCGDGQFYHENDLPTNRKQCRNERDRQVSLAMLSSFDHIGDVKCQSAFRCLFLMDRTYGTDYTTEFCIEYLNFTINWDPNCENLNESCPDEWIVLPEYPILYGYFQFIYFTNRSNEEFKINIVPDLVCFDPRKCPVLLSKMVSVISMNGLVCVRSYDLLNAGHVMNFIFLNKLFSLVYYECATTGNETICLNSSYFHCSKSLKCISYNRVGDGFQDCFYNEDESFPLCLNKTSNLFQCSSDSSKCLLPIAVGNAYHNCRDREDENLEVIYDFRELFPFPFICNTMLNIWVADINETDEKNCNWWPCMNAYSHCNSYWNCHNGFDELNCPNMNCSLNEFSCKDKESGDMYCLPFNNMFHYRKNPCTFDSIATVYFYNGSSDINKDYYSFNHPKCATKQDICNLTSSRTNENMDTCVQDPSNHLVVAPASDVFYVHSHNTYMCTLQQRTPGLAFESGKYLIAARLGYYPSRNNPQEIITKSNPVQSHTKFDSFQYTMLLKANCHYGVPIKFNDFNQQSVCFCPPNYFGAQCQWQNQRISLTLQIKLQQVINPPDAFQLIIMLIDDTGNIFTNYERLTYMPAHQCNAKFNLYLLYPDRPKNSSINYSIRIDLFDKSTLNYWNSWHLPIPFQFLPVNRVASQLIVSPTQRQQPCTLSCGEHGRCTTYSNIDTKQFCRCHQGYSGPSCNESYRCECSNDSYCLSRSICVCPLNKFGSRCYLKRWICESPKNPCENGGICVAQDDRLDLDAFLCICKESYHGDKCQHTSNRIDIEIDDSITSLNSSFLLYFIEATDGFANYLQTTALKKLPFGYNATTVYVSKRFHIVFIQIVNGDYYLAVLREEFIPSEHILTRIKSDNRCLFTRELLNDTFFNFEYLRRVKYYPLLCRQNPSLMCFYDDYHMCVCDRDRFSNCFKFNRTKTYDCKEQNICYNGGRCFMNNETCPTSFVCVCTDCFYGRQCNFTTRGFIFSLDPILGYHIKPNVTIYRQPPIVKFSIGLTLIMLVSELIMGSLSIITFMGKKSREVGCGYYLLASSVSSMCMILILTYKFWQLVLSQMAVITNRSFLQFNCVSIEILLRSCLATSEWLHACVAIERMFSVVKGVRFDKKKSRQAARGIIVVVIVCCVATHLHDPIHRELVDDLDGDQQRTWCLTQYSDIVRRYNSFITLFHFLTPFGINFMSTLVLIIQAARVRFKVDGNSQQSWMAHFQMKLKQHRHIILAPVMLLLLGMPRLIISFSLGCMRSPRQSWLFLIGYFLSFVPSILTIFIFILPSVIYREKLGEIIREAIKKVCRR